MEYLDDEITIISHKTGSNSRGAPTRPPQSSYSRRSRPSQLSTTGRSRSTQGSQSGDQGSQSPVPALTNHGAAATIVRRQRHSQTAMIGDKSNPIILDDSDDEMPPQTPNVHQAIVLDVRLSSLQKATRVLIQPIFRPFQLFVIGNVARTRSFHQRIGRRKIEC